MTEKWQSLTGLARSLETDRHESAKIFIEVAKRQSKRGTIPAADLDLIRRHYGRQALGNLSTEEYIEMRRSGEYDRLEEKFSLSAAEVARAEAALRRAGIQELSEWTQHGIMEAADARRMLEQLTEVDPSVDAETAISKAVKAATKGDPKPPFDEQKFARELAAAGIDVSGLSEEHLEKYGGDLPNLARVSRGQAPRVRANGEPPDEPDAQFVARLGRLIQHNAEQSAKPSGKSADTPEMPTDGRGVMSESEAAALAAIEQSRAAESAQ